MDCERREYPHTYFFMSPISMLNRINGEENIFLTGTKTFVLCFLKQYCRTTNDLKEHFEEAFPGGKVEVIAIRLGYNVAKLEWVYDQLKKAKSALQFCRKQEAIGKGTIKISLKLQSNWRPRQYFFKNHFRTCLPSWHSMLPVLLVVLYASGTQDARLGILQRRGGQIPTRIWGEIDFALTRLTQAL